MAPPVNELVEYTALMFAATYCVGMEGTAVRILAIFRLEMYLVPEKMPPATHAAASDDVALAHARLSAKRYRR